MPTSLPASAGRLTPPAALALAATALLLALGALLGGSARAAGPIAWAPCGAGAECGTLEVPLRHGDPDGPRIAMPVTRIPAADPARRIGALVVNFGGPGAPGAEILRDVPAARLLGLLGPPAARFDVVSFDPRGTGGTIPVDCRIAPEDGLSSVPVTPQTLDVDALVAERRRYADLCAARNPGVLEHLSTTDVARDMDLLRAALGEERLTYLGYSYGSFLGALYASLFPDRRGAMVLDGGVDAQRYVERPLEDWREQAAGFERALDRFLAACAADQGACAGFGAAAGPGGAPDPGAAFDALVEAADAAPIPAGAGRQPVSGLDIVGATVSALYAREAWPLLAIALAEAAAGDASTIRDVIEAEAGPDRAAAADRFVAVTALDARWPREVGPYLESARQAWGLFDHMWPIAGYETVVFGLWPASAPRAFRGPFRAAPGGPPVLVLGTTYDPATPYRWSVELARQLGNARLLTMRGDGHTAHPARSSCIDAAVAAYLVDGALPPAGTVCPQEVPFAAPPDEEGEREALENLALRLAIAGP